MVAKIKHCLVKGCPNTSDQGVFKGELCGACYDMLRTGVVPVGPYSFVNQMQDMLVAIYKFVKPAVEP
jgi:hypothetical protein